MKKTKKKSAQRASHKKTAKDLEIKPTKGGSVRGGIHRRDKDFPI